MGHNTVHWTIHVSSGEDFLAKYNNATAEEMELVFKALGWPLNDS
ncbi:MAG: hypothetical protein ABIA93_00605 [Candidatus Woesearchaeota archaeon]